MKRFALFLFMSASFISFGSKTTCPKPIYPDAVNYADSLPAQQLMVVVTNGWDSLRGHLYAFEKKNGKWMQMFSNAVVVGSKGFGMGKGTEHVAVESAPLKKEGDLKSPAGIFSIGTAFGYADHKDALWIKNPYIKASDTLICVDDARSVHYNTLLKNDPTQSDWKSFEEMHRKDDCYKWGLFINHNAPETIAGNGSCIFMHIWENNHTGTAGCTAMAEEDLLKILHWIDASMHPLLVQIPKTAYEKLATTYQLPKVLFN